MKTKRKIILVFCIAVLFLLASVCGTILYYYSHPSATKSLIEKSIARSTGTSFSIKALSYSFKPLRVRAKGIIFEPGEDLKGFHAEIPDLIADMALEGSFGHRSLTLKNLRIDGFSFSLCQDISLAEIMPKAKSPSLFSRMLRGMTALFLFRDIKFQATEIVNGNIAVRLRDQITRIDEIHARLNRERRIEITCNVRTQMPSKNITFTVPDLHITTDHAISLVDPEIRCLLTAQNASFQSPEMNIRSMDVKAQLAYHRKHEKLTFAPVDFRFEEIALKKETEKIGAGLDPVTLSGPVNLSGKIHSHKEQQKWAWHYDLETRLKQNQFSYTTGQIQLKGRLTGNIRAEGKFPVINISAAMKGDKTIVSARGMETGPFDLHLNTQCLFNVRDSKLKISSLDLSVNDILQLKGELNVRFGPQSHVGFELLYCHILPQKLLSLIPEKIRTGLDPVNLSGPVNLYGKIQGLKEAEKWSWQCNLETRLKQNQFSYTTGQIQLKGRLTGNIRAQGKFPDINISAAMKGDETILLCKGMELKSIKTSLSLSGKHPVYLINDLRVHVPKARVMAGKHELLIDDIGVNIRKGMLNGEKRSLFLPEIRLDSSWLKNILLSLAVEGGQTVINVHGKQTNLIKSALALNLLPQGWQFSGLDSIRIRAVQKEKGDWIFSSELGLQGLVFENNDSSCIGEKISISAKMDGEIDLKDSHIAADASFKINGGEILYDRFYLDLSRNAFSSSCQGRYDISDKFLELSNLRVMLKDILTLDIHGTFPHKTRDQRAHLSLNIPKTLLRPVFHHFVLEPFQTESPILADLNMGGAISANLTLSGKGNDWKIMGRCTWDNGELSLKSNTLSLQGINLDLPVWFQYSVTGDESQVTSIKRSTSLKEKTLSGELSVQSLILPLLPEQSMKLKLDAGPNMLTIKAPTILSIPGGKVLIGPVVGRDIFGVRPSVKSSLTMKAVRVNPLLSGIWSQPVKGTVSGKLDPIHFEGGTIRTSGDIRAGVFNGEIILSGLGASGLFTPSPVFKLNARLNALRLAQFTTGTSFGRIEGVLEGYIKDLEIAYGQPQRFDLLLETVKTKGVPQKISVRAVDNIARIGGGQSPFMGLAGAFSSLFKKFPYKKIGVHASLENDVFRINGTIKEGGKEYLVKRGGFSGVNIVNQNPDNSTSFMDMVKRIKRVTSTSGGPVIR